MENNIKIVKGDLFSSDEKDSLAHCVSRDFKMGKGIAVFFKEKFGNVQNLKDQNKQIGDIAVLKDNNRFVYYMITKERFYNKPTYESVKESLESVKEHCLENGVKNLNMPRIA